MCEISIISFYKLRITAKWLSQDDGEVNSHLTIQPLDQQEWLRGQKHPLPCLTTHVAEGKNQALKVVLWLERGLVSAAAHMSVHVCTQTINRWMRRRRRGGRGIRKKSYSTPLCLSPNMTFLSLVTSGGSGCKVVCFVWSKEFDVIWWTSSCRSCFRHLNISL